MSDSKEKVTMAERWEGLKSEFGKIVWLGGEDIAKQTTATVISSVIIALLIAIFDMLIQYGVDWLVKLGG